jgi:hypothetical protein
MTSLSATALKSGSGFSVALDDPFALLTVNFLKFCHDFFYKTFTRKHLRIFSAPLPSLRQESFGFDSYYFLCIPLRLGGFARDIFFFGCGSAALCSLRLCG